MPGVRILSGASVFLVSSVTRSAEYYRDALGFRFSRYWGEPPSFCMVWRDEQCIMLNQIEDAGAIRPLRTVNGAIWDAYLWVDDVDALFEEFRAAGARVVAEPFLKPYGVKECVIQDPDGYEICFGQEME